MSSGLKAVGKVLGAGNTNTSTYASENDILNYLKNYNTGNYDATLNNLVSNAYSMSQNLPDSGNYTFSVDGSDEARQRAENATYQSYVEKLQPQFANQTSDLETRLQNQGITVGSSAYNRAMTNLQDSQNSAYNQAAYQSVLNGQNAYSQSLNNAIMAGNFGNTAQSNYISQILSQLQGSVSGYDNALNTYNIQKGSDARIAQATQANQTAQTQAGIQALAQLGTLFSDLRLKTDIRLVGKLFNGLNVYCFNYIGSDTPRLGLIAQEVAEVIPEAVTADEDGYLRVRYDLASDFGDTKAKHQPREQ